MDRERRVVVVTGGGGGIGAAIATELGRRGDHVVTLDPLVSVDGTEVLAPAEETTAGRIVAAGGSAEASGASVTDRSAIAELFDDLVATHGRLDGVVNVAGITRPTGFATGDEDDWAAVLAVHLDGYRNVLDAALPHLAAAGRGRVLGVTSGSGWRAADAGAYSCAKRAVAALTWQLGRVAPPGVAVNAISPIAMTRMVTAALARAGGGASKGGGAGTSSGRPAKAKASRTGGLSLGSMPAPEDLGPLGAHLVGPDLHGLQGQVLFTAGSEVAVVDPPRLLEVVRTDGVASLDGVVGAVAGALAAAEAAQATTGGANARFGRIFDEVPAPDAPPGAAAGDRPGTALVVTDRPDLGGAVRARLAAAGLAVRVVDAAGVPAGFGAARSVLVDAAGALDGLDVVVTALAGASAPSMTGGGDAWQRVLADHDGLVDRLLTDASWARAAADHAAAGDRPLRLVTVVDAATPAGRSRAQAAAQLARASRRATGERVAALAVGMEAADQVEAAAALVGHLAVDPGAEALAGAELVVGPGWLGLRSHPRPAGTIAFGGPDLPPWFPDALAELTGTPSPEEERP